MALTQHRTGKAVRKTTHYTPFTDTCTQPQVDVVQTELWKVAPKHDCGLSQGNEI